MTDLKLDYPVKIGIGYLGGAGQYEATACIKRFSDRLVSPEGDLVRPIEVINTVAPVAVGHRHRYREVEFSLDSDNLEMMITQPVVGVGDSSRAMRDGALNDPIGYFVAQFKDTATPTPNNVSFSYATTKVWLTHAQGAVSNEHGTDENLTTYRFICTGARTVGTVNLTEAVATDRKITGITKVTCNSVDATNVLGFDWEYITDIEPQNMPNVVNPINVKEWTGKYWKIRLSFDTSTNIFDSYIDDDLAGIVIPSLSVLCSARLQDGTLQTLTYAWQANKCWISRVDPDPDVTWQGSRQPTTYEIICIGARTVTPANV